MRRARIVVAGAGVAGAIVARGLAKRDDVEVICLERVSSGAHGEAGTGLNVGPNAIKALAAVIPDLAETIIAASLPWRRWTIDLTDGTPLFDLDLATVADNPGVRIRWAELYRILREGVPVRYGIDVRAVERQRSARVRVDGSGDGRSEWIDDVDLVIAADGRYSHLRKELVGLGTPMHLGICMYRVLFPVGADCPIDDYGQWFNGPNRLLAFRVPGDLVYCAGTFPLEPPDAPVPEAMKDAETLRKLYWPADAEPCGAAAFLIEAITSRVNEIHWARVQEDAIAFAAPGLPVLFVGDASHPLIPTLGQGATQAVEDACATIGAVAAALDAGAPLASVPMAIDAIRRERVRFVMNVSREASDTMLAGADPVAGTLAKNGPDFRAKLARLYRDVPMPAASHWPVG